MAERDHATNYGPAHPSVFLRKALERFAVRQDLAARRAAGYRPRMRRTHHNAFEYGLAAHEGFLAALERRQQLH